MPESEAKDLREVVNKAIIAAEEKFRDGLLTAEQLAIVIRLLHIMVVIARRHDDEYS